MAKLLLEQASDSQKSHILCISRRPNGLRLKQFELTRVQRDSFARSNKLSAALLRFRYRPAATTSEASRWRGINCVSPSSTAHLFLYLRLPPYQTWTQQRTQLSKAIEGSSLPESPAACRSAAYPPLVKSGRFTLAIFEIATAPLD